VRASVLQIGQYGLSAKACATLIVGICLVVISVHSQIAPSSSEASRYTGLLSAAHRGDLAQVVGLSANTDQLNATDSYGRTAVHIATFAKNHNVIRALVKAGANLNLLENDRYDAVTIASVANDEKTLMLLLALGASAKLTTSRWEGTALIAAAHLGHAGVVRQLIQAGAPLDHVNNLHWTAAIEAIVLGSGGVNHQACLQALVDAGANLQLKDKQGKTPLQLARERGYTAIEKILEKSLAPK
jgi:uncharacterized protein